MADNRTMLEMLASISGQVGQEQNKLTELARQPIDRSFRQEGQSGLDVLRNPTEIQSRGLQDIALKMMGSDPRKGVANQVSSSISSGLSLMDTMKENRAKQALGAQELSVKGAQGGFDRAKDIIGMMPKEKEAKLNTTLTEFGGKKVLINSDTGEIIRELGDTEATITAARGGQVRSKTDEKKFAKLDETAINRQENIRKATDFLQAFESGAESGTSEAFKNFFPGQFTDQAAFNQELDAFAEQAARAALKAVGEIKPTDADVVGMKDALFGVGKGEQVNKNLLRSYLSEQIGSENQYRALQGLEAMPLPSPENLGGDWYAKLYGPNAAGRNKAEGPPLSEASLKYLK